MHRIVEQNFDLYMTNNCLLLAVIIINEGTRLSYKKCVQVTDLFRYPINQRFFILIFLSQY